MCAYLNVAVPAGGKRVLSTVDGPTTVEQPDGPTTVEEPDGPPSKRMEWAEGPALEGPPPKRVCSTGQCLLV